MNSEPTLKLFEALRALRLPAGHFAVFGSGPLLVRGIIDKAGDLDVICRGPAWDYVRGLSDVVASHDNGVEVLAMNDRGLTFGNDWAIGNVNIDELIDTAEYIDELPFVRLEFVVAYKRLADRPKDRAHLALLDAFGVE